MRAVRRVAIVQSSYVPWRGAFALMARCDLYVFLDSVQFTRRDWRTRNRIKTAQGPHWLTIPVQQKGNYHKPIDAMEVAEPAWAAKHLRTVEDAYARAPHFKDAICPVRDWYAGAASEPLLHKLNQRMTQHIAELLGLKTCFARDIDMIEREALNAMDPTERLAALAQAAGATHYLSGPSARSYLDEAGFNARGIAVEWMSYGHLAPYPQLWGPFEPAVSILDPLLTIGPAETKRMILT